MPRSRGRPTLINEKVQKEIVSIIQQGNYLETAAAYAGICVDTVRDWIRRGERENRRMEKENTEEPYDSEKMYFEFSVAVKKAKAQAEIRDVRIIGNAANESWQAAAWRLERKYYDRWGRKERHEHVGKDGGAIEVDYKRALIDQLDRVIGGDEDDDVE